MTEKAVNLIVCGRTEADDLAERIKGEIPLDGFLFLSYLPGQINGRKEVMST